MRRKTMVRNSQSRITNRMSRHEQSFELAELEGKAVSPLRSATALHRTELNRCGLAGPGMHQSPANSSEVHATTP